MTTVLANAMRMGKFFLVGGCLVGIMGGCSTKLRTAILSEEPSAKTQVAPQDPVPPDTETAVPAPEQPETRFANPPMDIPVEEPARPVIRPSVPAEIFATPRTGAGKPAEPAPIETPLDKEPVPPPGPIIADAPSHSSPSESPNMSEIPPLSFDPENPALPAVRENSRPEERIDREEPESIQEAGSASGPRIEEQPMEPDEQARKPQEPVQMAKVVPGASEPIENRMEDSLKTLEDVYFDYDRFTIRKEAIQVLEENAQALASALSDKNIVIEGHCDERGTESYNMVLGKRRANAVKEFLVGLGVPGDQLQVVSYGKEKPFCTDQNEQCWQENRRGHFVLK